MSTRMSCTRSGISMSSSRSTDEAERQAVRLRAEVVHPLDERDDLLPLLLLGGLLDAGVQVADGRVGETTVSPDSSSTSRSTPCVLGCCGPMLTVIVSVRSSVAHSSQPVSTISQIAWINVMWTSCTRAVQSSGTLMWISASAPGFPAVAAGERDRLQPARPRRLSAATTFGDAPLVEIPNATSPAAPSASTCRANTCSNAVVVGHARQQARVGRQRHRRKPRPLPLKPPDELGGEVLRVAGAAAVAEHQQLATGASAAGNGRGGRGHRRQIQAAHAPMQRDRRVEHAPSTARRAPASLGGINPAVPARRAASMFATNSSSDTCSGS